MYRKNKDNITVSPRSSPADLRRVTNNSSRRASNIPRSPARSPARSPVRSIVPDEEESTDIMISYSHQDRSFMEHLRNTLTEHGLSVWIDRTGLETGDNFLSKIGQAIINAKVFLAVVSSNQIASKYCRDELSLAYVSDKPIIPVALARQADVFPEMPTGMKLQLASFEWLLFDECVNEEKEVLVTKFDDAFPTLLHKIRSAIGLLSENEEDAPLTNRTDPAGMLHRMMSARHLKGQETDFWSANFPDQEQCDWWEFITKFDSQYRDELSQLYGVQELAWVFSMLQKELSVDSDGRLSRIEYETFLESSYHPEDFKSNHRKGQSSFFDRVNDYAIESFAVREVFRIESSVRVDAIENLGKFRSNSVVEALLDLLNDPDPNIRAVALVSLARTGHNSDRAIKRICATLTDPDRLVRESACLALGRLKNKSETVAKMVLERWRNDVISSVRESAELALHQLDSEPARVAIHMTEILQKEIKLLKE